MTVDGTRTVDDLLREARAGLRRLTPAEALAATRDGALIVDIRSELQRERHGLVPGAHFVPRNALEWRADPACAHRDPVLVAARGPLVLMCAEGYGSSLAAASLQAMGIDRATDMVDGFDGWCAAGLPVEPWTPPLDAAGRRAHWDLAFGRGDPSGFGWHETAPRTSLAMIAALGPLPEDGIIDVGGGTSGLAGALLERGARDVTVLDVSEVGLAAARADLGARADEVRWVRADVLDWSPQRTYALWHDRAMLHFLTDPDDARRYAATARRAVAPGGHAIVGAFAEDGPPTCSGLPVVRRDAGALVTLFGDGAELVDACRVVHRTPGGRPQPFTWVALRLSP